ncbi:Pkinase-domain-containing protein [Auricularia subglabra TFB-10046 SS5]|uniref:non-specific serine/threonine protein kinase n=1 Tax=Auricularia subglabra (strain TFB-10046 / SS5) TaxID=717982 RepID=J0D9I0_AURST|nr:Pkinase-domain-containing protein [Auricularia subglabra TFB-10046 SS5]
MSSTTTTAREQPARASVDAGSQDQRQSSRVRLIGDYALGKTLGAGSMGKVKLAHHIVTGERVAIKIVPRAPPPDPHATGPEAAKQAAKDANKELRTVREAAMAMLVQHPYICGMREMLVQPGQYLMVLEYVAGGQMLDYIIAHGRLRERVARKFARQIGSALAYCHANSIVHRDLKIENILIAHSGDIKLIDFGLSNLYNPASHLSTFAGSLYFAAPELLNAKPYTGPEVDVWSFGVVLYVLVCGRVPFDDQSMPALHAKIKRGVVEYPPWLSADCKSLLSRMLVTIPAQRAALTEVLNHPWMNLGYTSTPNTHVPPRTPLRADELDPAVIRGMSGFEFGSDAEITQKLRDLLNSDAYQRACARHTRGTTSASTFATTLGSTSSVDVAMSSASSVVSHPSNGSTGGTTKGSRRFSGLNFDHYRRKLFSSASSGPNKDPGSNPPPSALPASMSSSSLVGTDGNPLDALDPTRGFHPLISVYFMVREKLERERLAREQEANPQPATHSHSRQATGDSVHETPSDTTLRKGQDEQAKSPQTQTERTPAPPKEKERLRVPPSIAPPQPMRLGGAEHAVVSGPPSAPPSAATPASPAPRARMADVPVSPLSPIPPTKEDAAAAVKPPPASAHRRSVSVQKPLPTPSSQHNPPPPPQQPASAPASRISPSPSAPASRIVPSPSMPQTRKTSSPVPGMAGGATTGSAFARRFGSITGSTRRRTSSLVGAPPATERPERVARNSLAEGEVLSDSEGPAGVGRWGTIGRRWKGARVSGAGANANAGPSEARPTTAGVAGPVGVVDEEEEEVAVASVGGDHERAVRRRSTMHEQANARESGAVGTAGGVGASEFKAVPLKGSFSVATTSTKGATALRSDVRRTLTRMGIAFREISGGFECAHEPSIVPGSSSKMRPLRKKTSKLSIGSKKKPPQSQPAPPTPVPPPKDELKVDEQHQNGDASVSSSLVHLAATAREASERPGTGHGSGRTPSPVAVKVAQPPSTPIRRDFAQGNVNAPPAEWFDKSSPLGVRFEIHIVKVPILPLHGIQFRRVAGDGWQYQMLARRVLTELKL